MRIVITANDGTIVDTMDPEDCEEYNFEGVVDYEGIGEHVGDMIKRARKRGDL